MKYIRYILAAMFFPAIVTAQQNTCTLSVKAATLKEGAYVFLLPPNGGDWDSAAVTNGVAKFTTTIDEPLITQLFLKHFGNGEMFTPLNYKLLYLQPGNISVNVTDADSVFNAAVEGSQSTVDYDRQLIVPITRYNIKTHTIGVALMQARKEQNADTVALEKAFKENVRDCFNVPQVYIKAHPNAMLSIIALNMLGNGGGQSPVTVNDLQRLYNSLSDKVRNSPDGLKYKKKLDKLIQNWIENSNDGPYVFHNGQGNIIIQTIKKGDADSKPLEGNTVNISLAGHPDWGFSVTLRQALQTEPCAFPAPKKLFVVSDIEGEFAAFRSLLLANHIIDKNYNWTFSKGHLVINGDLFDRGKEVVQELWLLYKLEDEAKEKGGYVHTILGNHDIMNLSGDLRYVDKKYFEAAKLMGKDYMQLYDKNTELGRWLRTKNVMEKIGDRLFIHGGVSPVVNAMGLSVETINSECRQYYGIPRKEIPAPAQDLFNQNALFWYRGYFMNPRATQKTIDSTLQLYHCKQIIVGHTIVKERNPALYYGGKVLGVDVDMHEGRSAAVLIEHGKCYKVDDKGNKVLLKFQLSNDIINADEID